MKTIKELNKEIYEADTSNYRADKESKIETLKDVIKLIDEVRKLRLYRSKSCQLLARRLKARIEG